MCVETCECQEIMEAGVIIRPSQYCTRVGLPENFFLNFSSLRNIFGFFPWFKVRHNAISSRIELLNQLFPSRYQDNHRVGVVKYCLDLNIEKNRHSRGPTTISANKYTHPNCQNRLSWASHHIKARQLLNKIMEQRFTHLEPLSSLKVV